MFLTILYFRRQIMSFAKRINLMFKSKSRMKQKVDIVHFIKVGIIFVQQHEDYCINLKECDNKK